MSNKLFTTKMNDDGELPDGWEIAMSRRENRPYYLNSQTNKVYWFFDDLPKGWSQQLDDNKRKVYFHISDKQGTATRNKPEKADSVNDTDRKYSFDQEEASRQYEDDMPAPPSTHTVSETNHAQEEKQETTAPPVLSKKRSLKDLLSPGPPAVPNTDSPPPMDSSSMPTPTVTSVSPNDQQAAASFYNQLKRAKTTDRTSSLLFHMRNLNNWVKSVLINEYAHRNDRVFDLACGKGGDLMKWTKQGVRAYIGADIAAQSLRDAVERVTNNRDSHRLRNIRFIEADLGIVDFTRDELNAWTEDEGWHRIIPLTPSDTFDVLSIQFSFHYLFADESRAHNFFRMIQTHLSDDGTVIATTVDPSRVLQKFFASNDNFSIRDERGREVCAIQLDDETKEKVTGYDASKRGSFGLRYKFTLRDNADEKEEAAAVDLPEYLVPLDLLLELLDQYGLELVLQENFHSYIKSKMQKHQELLRKMRVANCHGSISDAEWEIAGLYQVLVFRKKRGTA